MSKMAKPAGPSLAPELAMAPAGSSTGISPALSQLTDPPIWTFDGVAVVVVACTLPMPLVGALEMFPVGATALLLRVVAVVGFLVVAVVALVVAPVLAAVVVV